MILRTLSFLILTAVFCTPAPALHAGSEIIVGVVGSTDARPDSASQAAVAGAVRAVRNINRGGGLLGRTVQIAQYSSACQKAEAARLAAKLKAENVALVAGHGCDRAALAAASVYGHDGPVFISPLASSPTLTDENGFRIFRLAGRADLEPAVTALFLSQFYTGRRTAILYQDAAPQKAFALALRRQIRALDLQEELFQALPANTAKLVEELRRNKIGVAVLAAGMAETARLAKAIQAAGLTVQLIGRSAAGDAGFRQLAGPAAEGFIAPQRLHPRDMPAARPLLPALEGNAGGFAVSNAAAAYVAAYAAVEAWASAVRAADSFAPAKVAEKLHEIAFKTKAGDFRFDIKGDATLPPFAMYQWQGDRLVYLPPPSANACARPPSRLPGRRPEHLRKLDPSAL